MPGPAGKVKLTDQLRIRRMSSTIRSMALQKKKRTCKASILIMVLRERIQHLLVHSGEYRIILLLVGVLSRGKVAKKLADRAIDLMEDVQNLRKAIYPYVYLACCVI